MRTTQRSACRCTSFLGLLVGEPKTSISRYMDSGSGELVLWNVNRSFATPEAMGAFLPENSVTCSS